MHAHETCNRFCKFFHRFGVWIIPAVLFVWLIVQFVTLVHEQRRVTFQDGKTITVRLSLTDAEKAKGLSGTLPLYDDHGMLFLFNPPATPGFWMKDMAYPIDIIWIVQDRVLGVTPDISPVTYETRELFRPPGPVSAVLEVRAGFAHDHRVEAGQPIATGW